MCEKKSVKNKLNLNDLKIVSQNRQKISLEMSNEKMTGQNIQ